jgi:POT family proton-dependent oligopeptide transporter
VPINQASHPKTLPLFFGTEMWERYGFYIVQSLLALYLAIQYGWNDAHIYILVGSFTALTYLSPVIGGWIADRLLGQKTSIILGAILLLFNYTILAIIHSKIILTLTLAGISVGTGLLKPNISSLLGNQYPENSPLRESGFTIFYMGITTGIILGTTLPSQLYHHFGWSIAFASAALGMILSVSIFIFGILRYSIRNYHPHTVTFFKALTAFSIIILMWISAFYILNYPQIANLTFSLVVIFSLAYILYSASQEDVEQAKKTLIIGLLCIISTLFWAFYFQMFTSLTFFIHRLVEPSILGYRFPAPYYVSVQSIGMLIFGFFLTKKKRQSPNNQQTIATKFLIAVFLMTLAYALITLVTNLTNPEELISPLWIILAYLMISIAELLLSPVGLYAITILASRKNVSTMMGIFFISLGLGAFLSGKLATIAAIGSGKQSLSILNTHYAIAFTKLLGILMLTSLLCVFLYLIIRFLSRNNRVKEILNESIGRDTSKE